MAQRYDLIVVGAGHAGCEAAFAGARMGLRTLLLTLHLDHIAQMSCNPAIGGLGKSHLVADVDALGGQMGTVADATAIQFRVLNRKKGAAVQALRVQSDRAEYILAMRRALEQQDRLFICQDMAREVLADGRTVAGVRGQWGDEYLAPAVVLASGTFMNGLIHVGLLSFPAGRAGDFPATGISESLAALGLRLGRLKTGTPPRLDGRTIDFSRLERQDGDEDHPYFSWRSPRLRIEQVPCHVTYTNAQTHAVIRAGLDRSPLYGGQIKGVGPRYCPSIETKVLRFSDRDRHQVFLEPEGRRTVEYYANGISTSLPADVQQAMVHSIEGLEEAQIIRPAYAVEYDFIFPDQLRPTLECKEINGLFLSGQIIGTSGYEEAAALGLVAGINAALQIRGEPPLVLPRSESYIGVMIDDLVTKGVDEPYRMFTSRAEYRLLLRCDNALRRLSGYGKRIGLLSAQDAEQIGAKLGRVDDELARLSRLRISPSPAAQAQLAAMGQAPLTGAISALELLRRPGIAYCQALALAQEAPREFLPEDLLQIETEIRYEGYLKREAEMVARTQKLEQALIPDNFDYALVAGLSTESRQRLEQVRPRTLGQAGRIPGIPSAAVTLIMIALKRRANHG